MKTVPLGSLIAPAKAVRAGENSYQVLSITMHEGLVFQQERFKKAIAGKDLSNYKVVNRGQLVVGFPIDEAVLDFQELTDAGIVSPAYGVWDVINAETVNSSYLGKYLRSPQAISYYKLRLRGTTARRRSLPKDTFEALPVPLPPLTEQQRIVEILDEIGSVRRRRAQALERLSELETSLFERLAKKSEHPMASLSSLNTDFISGKNIVAKSEPSHPFSQVVKVSAVSSGYFNPNESKPLPADYTPPERHRIEKGDVLFSRASGTLDLIGATCLVDQEVNHLYLPDKVWKLKVGEDSPVNPLFVYYSLRSNRSRNYFRNQASGASGVRNISKKKVLQLEVPVPPSKVQNSFLKQALRIREMKKRVEELLKSDNELFHALSTRAFTGKL